MTAVRSNPAWLLEHNKLEKQVKEYKRLYGNSDPNQRLADPNGIITVQVVVHIIHRTGEAIGVGANLSVAQVQSQIDVLNEDFSRTNPDANQTPNAFAGVAANPMIRFELACVTPDGFAPSNGITRTPSGAANFNNNRNGVKFTNQGGIDAWATDRYLNIWVAPDVGVNLLGFTESLLNFASQPNRDGIVVRSDVFGRGAGFNLNAQFNLGRTVTHEVGHWLNLIHVWGPNNGGQPPSCTDTDECNDTPNQSIENTGVPAFPRVSCNNGPNGGDMFMNYMDFSDDVAMNVFSNDQRARMRALFMPGGLRASFVNNLFNIFKAYLTCSGGTFVVRTPYCAANGNVQWTITGPATVSGSSIFTSCAVYPQSNANGTAVLTASWNNLADDFIIPIGYGAENSTYTHNYGTSNLINGATSINGYNRYTYINANFTGAIGPAKNWRLVSSTAPVSLSPTTTTNNFWIYMTQPYQWAIIRAEIPTQCGDRTVEYTFLSGYVGYNYAISPNPASNDITISASVPNDPNNRAANPTVEAYEVQIFDSSNQLLKKTKVKKDERDVTIDVSRFPSNQFYTVKLISGNDVQTKTFFKQ